METETIIVICVTIFLLYAYFMMGGYTSNNCCNNNPEHFNPIRFNGLFNNVSPQYKNPYSNIHNMPNDLDPKIFRY